MTHAQDLLDRWGFGPDAPPLPGRVADRLAEVVARLDAALTSSDLEGARDVLSDLSSLRDALDLWKSVELDSSTLQSDPPRLVEV